LACEAAGGSGHTFIAKQLLRATSSIGSNLEEGAAPSSRRDMAAKYPIALREARESKFWLNQDPLVTSCS
jgi:four helix bundle protein